MPHDGSVWYFNNKVLPPSSERQPTATVIFSDFKGETTTGLYEKYNNLRKVKTALWEWIKESLLKDVIGSKDCKLCEKKYCFYRTVQICKLVKF